MSSKMIVVMAKIAFHQLHLWHFYHDMGGVLFLCKIAHIPDQGPTQMD